MQNLLERTTAPEDSSKCLSSLWLNWLSSGVFSPQTKTTVAFHLPEPKLHRSWTPSSNWDIFYYVPSFSHSLNYLAAQRKQGKENVGITY